MFQFKKNILLVGFVGQPESLFLINRFYKWGIRYE